MTEPSIVLPVSTLKAQANRVFAKLAEGTTVYVSKHGRVVAAFVPHEQVPRDVAASYTSPGRPNLAEVTSTAMMKCVPSREVSDATEGLPALATKDGKVFGMLVRATAPVPAVVPDSALAADRSRALDEYLKAHPDATAEDAIAFTEEWRPTLAHRTTEDIAASMESRRLEIERELEKLEADALMAKLDKDLQDWNQRGSSMEGVASSILIALGVATGAVVAVTALPAALGFATGAAMASATTALRALVSAKDGDETALLRQGERHQTNEEFVPAREAYLAALIADDTPSPAAMWRLGDLARSQDHKDEAAAWYQNALEWDGSENAAKTFGKLKPV